MVDWLETIASVLAILTAPYSLWQLFYAIWNHLSKYLQNDRRNLHLQNVAQIHIDIIEPTVKSSSSREAQRVYQELHLLLGQLKSFQHRPMRMLSASTEHYELDSIEQRLERLERDIVEVLAALEQESAIRVSTSTVSNKSFDLPSCEAGFNRVKRILEFMDRSLEQDFRVIAIHGQPGLGKTTLLEYVWNNISEAVPFRYARAYVQIGHEASPFTIRQSQTSVLRQLGGDDKEFPDDGFGREELNKHFQQLKKPLFLAIDNVFEVRDLECLLPKKLGSGNLPTSSCVVVTCRNYRIVEALVTHICGLQESDADRVLCYEPSCLDQEESRRVFAECARMKDSASKHKELLDELVPLCGGLPLALTVFGKVFAKEDLRAKVKWQLIREQWEALDDEDDVNTLPVRKAFRVSFDKLGPSRQIAFLDMVSTYYGWPWERVERIVNVEIMKDLRDSSLVREEDGIDKCNQSALRIGHDWGNFDYFPNRGNQGSRVSMHDLTLRFGESYIVHSNNLEYRQYVRGPVQDLQLSKLRHLIMVENSDVQEALIQHATGLQMLALVQHPESNKNQAGKSVRCSTDEDCFQATCCNESRRSSKQQLHYLRLERCTWSRSILGILEVSRELRELTLEGCSDLVQLPDIPLPNLELLEINDCPVFEGLSVSCVKEWGRLKAFNLRDCPCITVIPEDLGSLPSLRQICIQNCTNLESFPSLSSPNGPFSLRISMCPRLHTLGDMLCPLKSLRISTLPAITRLPVSIFNASSLQTLSIRSCEGLVELLPEGDITSCSWSSFLKLLAVQNCGGLRRLPAGIFLQTASNWLTELNFSYCTNLEKLPDSVTGVTSLKILDLDGCESLTELPKEIGGLCSLRELNLGFCKKLEKLPDSVTGITSLMILDLDGCESLTELPQEIGGLCSLRELKLEFCIKLGKLPDSVTGITSLLIFNLSRCESLTELPQEIGGLCSLRELKLRLCRKLEKLPDCMIARMTSLKVLHLDGCESLTELPDCMIASMTSLERLRLDALSLGRRRKLQNLPDLLSSCFKSLEKLTLCGVDDDDDDESPTELPAGGLCYNLKELRLEDCPRLTKLPQELGAGLCSLKKLSLHDCRKVEKIPDSIATITSLECLELWGCESLTRLPQEMGGLCSLRYLTFHGCEKLGKLPDSIPCITSLEWVWVSECKSIVGIKEIEAILGSKAAFSD